MSRFKNPVVFTGAVVFLEQYNALVSCDLREIEGAVLIHTKTEWKYHPDSFDFEHKVTHVLSDRTSAAYVSPDKKVIMAPASCCIGERR